MKRSQLIQDLVRVYETRPEGCSSYHIIDMLIYAAEKRGMQPPGINKTIITDSVPYSAKLIGGTVKYTTTVNEWEPEDEDLDSDAEDEDLDSDAEARKSFWKLNQEVKTRKLSDIHKEMDEINKRKPNFRTV